MQYFNTLPKIIYTDNNKNSSIMTNLMARASIIPSLLSNPLVYYSYDIQEGDTPEIIAHKYYNDIYRYWMVLFANNILDPQWNWPMSYDVFNKYITDKYTEFDPRTTTHHWEKTITQFDSGTNTTTTNTIEISEETYNSLGQSTTSYNLPTGTVTVSVTKQAVNYYDWESNLNESKRSIKILNVAYADQLEAEFMNLMK